jgi:hypothetical protein
MTKKRSVQADKVRPFAGQPFAFVGHTHPGVTDIITDHNDLDNIGSYTHAQVDTHIDDATLHFTQAAISITESQISNLGVYALASHNHNSAYLAITADSLATLALKSSSTTINVSSATAPAVGQVLTATGGSAATWQTPAAASSGNIVQTGTPLATHIGYFTADKNLSGDAGLTWIVASARLNISGAAPVLRLHDNDNAASSMTTKVEFYDNSPALVGEIGYLLAATASLSIKTTIGGIILDTSGAAQVVITGDGDIAIGGFINGYAGSPQDGSVLMWVDANTQAEFTLGVMMNSGTPVAEQIAVFSAEAAIEGDANFTWDGADFTVGALAFTGATSQVVLGDGTLSNPGITINGSATATPSINLLQDSVTRAVWRFSNSADRVELSSPSDEIALRPGNVDRLVITSALTTLTTTDFLVTGTTTSNKAIAGDPGLEGTGITVNGALYESVLKASDIGGANAAQFIMHRHSTVLPAIIVGARSKTDDDTHAVVADNDILMDIIAAGNDGTDYAISSEIRFEVDGTPASDDMPGLIRLMTAPSGTQVPLTAMMVDSAQVATFFAAVGAVGAITGSNLSGTNTGDNAVNTLYSGLVSNATHTGDVTGSGLLTIVAKAVHISMLDDGTDGELITWSAAGVATTVPVGTVGHILTSGGAGVAPTFQAAAAVASSHLANAFFLMGA